MTRPIRIAAQIPPAATPTYAAWRDTILRAEDLGTDAILGYDHFLVPAVTGRDKNGRPITDPNPPVQNNFEAWTALASWAEITSRAELGLLVGGAGFRNPDLVADMARTIDHISGGRLILGLGAGWYEPDYTEYGYEYGTVSSRHELFIDALERIENRLPNLMPPPLRKIPVLIGGGGEKKTIPAAARFADIWHTGGELDLFVRKTAILAAEAAKIGRDDTEIERAVSWVSTETADGYADAGATMFTVSVFGSPDGYDLAELKAALAWRDSRG
ncbi:LLM class F420-dependent oxidoreductase [Mycobacterium sp. 3519A]|jgi:probable F420-dependent oxidoreductase|uniref:LLM class F420-dependent oxidoreductase n=1 Tax=Mycobacterium sp. 3519A TaxID=2057184 RepID=UPI000C7C2F06|nr:LLM class F420-dependent oxidoreductase [Mycobacterium sp. 3519A]